VVFVFMLDIIGIDWGTKVCGIAFGAIETGLVVPAGFEVTTRQVFNVLKTEIEKRKTSVIVVGMPTNFAGEPTEVSEFVRDFITNLQLYYPTIKIETVNERGTTMDSNKKLYKPLKYQLDNQAAAEILGLYLAKNSRK
jgi:putative transcription antitermination factor YqgF